MPTPAALEALVPAHPEDWRHTPHVDVRDAALAHGAAFWCSLVETELA